MHTGQGTTVSGGGNEGRDFRTEGRAANEDGRTEASGVRPDQGLEPTPTASSTVRPHAQTPIEPRSAPSQEEGVQAKRDLLRIFNPDGLLPRAGQNFLSQMIFREGRTVVTAPERNGLIELREIGAEITALGDVLSKSAREEFLGDVLAVLIEKHAERASNPIQICATTCPDYAFDPEKRVFQFDRGINSGVGLVGLQLLDRIDPVARMLSSHSVPVQVLFLYADHEAQDPFLQEQMGLCENDYQEKIDASIAAMREHGTAFFAEKGTAAAVRAGRMSDFMTVRVSAQDIEPSLARGLFSHRRPLYDRLFSRVISTGMVSDYHEFVVGRAAADIADHQSLGRSVAARRQDGELVSIATLSIKPLANHLTSGDASALPVFRFDAEY